MIFGFAFVPTDSQAAEMVCIFTLFASVFSAFIVSGDSVELKYNNVMNVANFAMNVHNHMSSYPYDFKVVDIISYTCSSYNIQVFYSEVFDMILCMLQLYPPAWVKYVLQIQAVQTVCENHASVNVTDCALQSNAEVINVSNNN